MSYKKPQNPLINNGFGIYPLTTADQIILSDGSRLEKNGIVTAADSSKLNGQSASYYATASALSSLTDRVAALEAIPNANGVSY